MLRNLPNRNWKKSVIFGWHLHFDVLFDKLNDKDANELVRKGAASRMQYQQPGYVYSSVTAIFRFPPPPRGEVQRMPIALRPDARAGNCGRLWP